MARKHRYRRGYPVALLVGVEAEHAVLWRLYSRVIKLSLRLELDGKRVDSTALYNFHESLVDSLKPVLKEGVKTIVVAAPARTSYATDFLNHINKHHQYLIQSKRPNRANFAELVGSAKNRKKVAELVKSRKFINLIAKTTSEEADQAVNSLEKHLYSADNNSSVLYSLKEIEGIVHNLEKDRELKTENMLLTDKYLAECKQKNRINRLFQIAKNKKVKTRIINAETPAGSRISQFGGIVYFSNSKK
jgi:stalled ribosome rescue protein Dom34